MTVMKLLLVLLSLAAASTSTLAAVTGADVNEAAVSKIYYVNRHHPSASDSNTGTSSNQPFLTVGKAFSEALTQLENGIGTKILIFPGLYREEPMLAYARYWNESAQNATFIIEGTEKHKVILTGAEAWTTGWSEVVGHPGDRKSTRLNSSHYS